MNGRSRARVRELLDGDSLTLKETERALDDLIRSHRRLFGYGSVLRTLTSRLAGDRRGVLLLDVGTGAGDVTDRLARRLGRLGVRLQVVGIDRKLSHLLFGRRRGFDQLRVLADVEALPFRDDTFDWALSNLFLHHFDRSAGARLLRTMLGLAPSVAVVDLRSAPGATWVVGAALRLLRVSPAAHHDGIVSTRQAWSIDEVRGAVDAEVVELRRRFPVRFSLVMRRRATGSDRDKDQSPEVNQNPGAFSPSHPGS